MHPDRTAVRQSLDCARPPVRALPVPGPNNAPRVRSPDILAFAACLLPSFSALRPAYARSRGFLSAGGTSVTARRRNGGITKPSRLAYTAILVCRAARVKNRASGVILAAQQGPTYAAYG